MQYHHLTLEQRSQIEVLQSMGHSQKEIALQLQVSPSTICRELSRNAKNDTRYVGREAQTQMGARRSAAGIAARTIDDTVIFQIECLLRQDWSPEQISGYLKRSAIFVSHEWIYRHIRMDKKYGGDLYKHLRHGGKKYNYHGAKNAGRGCIPNRRDIKARPAIVEEKSRLGDWEIDLIVGAGHQGVILSIVDRKSKLTLLTPLADKTAAGVTAGIKRCFDRLARRSACIVHTITSDNGKEFAEHARIAVDLHCDFFFATPYHSWERGLNEHTNGLVRQYFPKKTSFAHLTVEEVQVVEDKLNDRPRKILQYLTPYEVWLKNSPAQLIALGS